MAQDADRVADEVQYRGSERGKCGELNTSERVANFLDVPDFCRVSPSSHSQQSLLYHLESQFYVTSKLEQLDCSMKDR